MKNPGYRFVLDQNIKPYLRYTIAAIINHLDSKKQYHISHLFAMAINNLEKPHQMIWKILKPPYVDLSIHRKINEKSFYDNAGFKSIYNILFYQMREIYRIYGKPNDNIDQVYKLISRFFVVTMPYRDHQSHHNTKPFLLRK